MVPDLDRLCWELAGVVGVDARDFSLRQLDHMARARLREEWEQTAAVMAWVGRVGPWVDPRRLNPFHREPPKTAEQEKAEGRTAFRLLERALKDIAGVR